jgi:AI-2 transport protein TqsA
MVSIGAGTFVAVLSKFVLILLFMLFILAGDGMFARKVESAYHAKSAGTIGTIISEVEKKIRRYLVTVTTINVVSGVITAVILSAFGVDLALLWGLLTFLVNFIPTIGSIIAIVLPIAVAFLQFDTVGTPIVVAAVLIVTQFLLGSVITPKVMGSSLNLSPLLVLISLIFWGWVWGPWGMILSVPITSTIKILLENIEGMKPISVLMSAEPGQILKEPL